MRWANVGLDEQSGTNWILNVRLAKDSSFHSTFSWTLFMAVNRIGRHSSKRDATSFEGWTEEAVVSYTISFCSPLSRAVAGDDGGQAPAYIPRADTPASHRSGAKPITDSQKQQTARSL